MLVNVFEDSFDGIFDVLERDEGVVGFVRELTEDSDLVRGRCFAFEFEYGFGPFGRG